MKKFLAWIPAICIAAVIFFFSAQPADISTEMSDGVTRLLLATAEKANLYHTDPGRLYAICEFLSVPVRKSAHITEYAVLHISILFALAKWDFKGTKWLKTAWAMAVLYAASDEFHQLFVPGRAGLFTDVCIDSIGVTLITVYLWRRYRKRQRENS